MYKSIFKFFMILPIIFLGGLCIWFAHNRDPKIYRAEYLDDIFPKSDFHKTFIISSGYFNKPNCRYIENWARHNIRINQGNEYEFYTFLRYSNNITKNNKYLDKEYDAIIGDYTICEMSTREYSCFICYD